MRNLWIIAAAVLACAALPAREAAAQTVSVHVVQVRASNEGGESVDPLLAGLIERIKRQYPYRNYKRVGSDSESGGVGDALSFNLYGDRSLALTIAGVEGDQVVLRAAVTRGRETIINTTLKVRNGRSFLIGVPLGGDKLILVITPTVK